MAIANNNPSIFIVMLGTFTSAQLNKIKVKGSYNVDTFRKIYSFLHENNEHYVLLPPLQQMPMPNVEHINMNDDDTGTTEIDESIDEDIEQQLCWKYWFPAVEDPNDHSATYQNQSEFA